MTLREAIAKLAYEKEEKISSRFHCRAIQVGTIAEYARLLVALKKLGNTEVFPIDDLFAGTDVMPDYERLMAREYQEKWLILPGVSEYLRLFHANEERTQRFGTLWHHQWDASTKGRILIPLWGLNELWHDRALGLCTDARQEEHVLDCAGDDAPQRMSIQVFSSDFEQYLSQWQFRYDDVFRGLKAWYQFWYEPQVGIEHYRIVTGRFRGIKPTNGAIKIHVVSDTLGFLRENLLGGTALTEDICPKEAQECLIPEALQGKSLNEAILSALNVQTPKPIDIISKWSALKLGEQQLCALWYALNPDDTYLCYCVKQCGNINELSERILTAWFQARHIHPEWAQEALSLIDAGAIERNDAYFQNLNAIPSQEERLAYLTDGTARERRYIIRMVGQWMRDDREAALQCPALKKTYPALFAYLENAYPDEALGRYFAKYKAQKLMNTLPEDEGMHFEGFDAEAYDTRYHVLRDEVQAGETFVLWIDALGAEWLPLLTWALRRLQEGEVVSARVAQALLPSETRFNEQWNQMNLPSEKYDKLDKLAHQGVVDDNDYYACIEEQIRFVTGVAEKVEPLLKQYARVLITGDHGTSRLAARFFHAREGVPAPENAEVGSHGRYCRTSNAISAMKNTQKVVKRDEENSYIVFSNYDHYTKSGFAAGAEDDKPIYGEIHGGASPEEMLVPVISVKSSHEMPLTANWGMAGNSVKVRSKRVKCTLRFSKPVSALKARMDGIDAACEAAQLPAKEWTLTFAGMNSHATKLYDVTLMADGRIVPIEKLKVISALEEEDPF